MFFLHKDGQSIPKRGARHALGALAYVGAVVLLITNLSRLAGTGEDGPLAPVAFLLLLVLSVATMGLLIFGAPIMLYLDGKKKEAVQLLAWTIGSLAAITFAILTVMILMSRQLS